MTSEVLPVAEFEDLYAPEPLYPGSHEHLVDEVLGRQAWNTRFLRDSLQSFSFLENSVGQPRYGLICGAANGSYVRALASETGIPFTNDAQVSERLELSIGYFVPRNGDKTLIDDHTFMKSSFESEGRRFAGYIDVVHPLLWNNAMVHRDRVQEFINYRVYPEENFDEELAKEFGIYPFDESTPLEIWRHPLLHEFGDKGSVTRLTKLINQPEIPDLGGNWCGAARELVARWTGVDGQPKRGDDVIGVEPRPISYRQPQLALLEDFPTNVLPLTLTRVTEAVTRERFNRAVAPEAK